MAQKGARVKVVLACTECKQRNYNLTKTSRSIPTEWSFKNTADSAKSIPCTEKLSKAG